MCRTLVEERNKYKILFFYLRKFKSVIGEIINYKVFIIYFKFGVKRFLKDRFFIYWDFRVILR